MADYLSVDGSPSLQAIVVHHNAAVRLFKDAETRVNRALSTPGRTPGVIHEQLDRVEGKLKRYVAATSSGDEAAVRELLR